MEKLDLSSWANCPLIVDQITIDSRRITSQNSLFVALTGAHFDGHAFVRAAFRSGSKACLVRKDFQGLEVSDDKVLIRVDDPLKTLQEMALAYRKAMSATVIALTGSFGKTMLKDLLYTLFKAEYPTCASPESFNSQIGVALSLFKIKATDRFAIIEAGISEAGEMDRLIKMIQPDHAILTNLSRSITGQTLAEEKIKLLQSVPKGNWVLAPESAHVEGALFGISRLLLYRK